MMHKFGKIGTGLARRLQFCNKGCNQGQSAGKFPKNLNIVLDTLAMPLRRHQLLRTSVHRG